MNSQVKLAECLATCPTALQSLVHASIHGD